MPDHDPSTEAARRTLSEISHLFLTDVRDRQTGGIPRPRRMPPGQRAPAVPLEPASLPQNCDRFSNAFSAGIAGAGQLNPEIAPLPPVTGVIAAHLGGGQAVRQYARHLAARVGRVGLIEVDGGDVRITCFERPFGDDIEAGQTGVRDDDALFAEAEIDDPRSIAEAIEELDWDVHQWLLAVSNFRTAEARSLMLEVGHWVLLSTCDHDGIVSSYRAIKGQSDALRMHRPRLTLALLDAGGEPEEARAFAKLSGVCEQFLNWRVEPEPAVRLAPGVTDHPVLYFRQGGPSADGVTHWSALADRVKRAGTPRGDTAEAAKPPRRLVGDVILPVPYESLDGATSTKGTGSVGVSPAFCKDPHPNLPPEHRERDQEHPPGKRVTPGAAALPEESFVMNEPIVPTAAVAPTNTMRLTTEAGAPAQAEPDSARRASAEVLDLGSEGSAESILAAILTRPESGLVECPVRPPTCPSARLTIDRDRRVILLAVAREGLAELRSIGQAYRWLIENRALIAMAVPQLAIDAHQFPRLRLLVDHADTSAGALQPMLQSGHVTVQTYRRVHWGTRTGLLLDAA